MNKHIVLNIEGMTCSACSSGLEHYLNKQVGVEATINLVMATASINYDTEKVSLNDIERFIKDAGFKSGGEQKKNGNSHLDFLLLLFFAFLSIFLMYLSMHEMFHLPILSILDKMKHPKLYVSILLVSSFFALLWGSSIIKNGIKNILHKMPNMDSLIGIGVLVNFFYSLYQVYFIYMGEGNVHQIYFESVVMILLFVKIGRFIDKKNKAKAIDTIKNLVTLTPKQATILVDEKEKVVSLSEIEKGMLIISKPGEKIAVDGIIKKGSTHTDESFITGESKPVKKSIGDLCLAGSINYDGVIVYEAQHIGKDSSISHIVDLVVDATNTKAPIARLADTISRYFVPFIFVVALLSFLLNFVLTKNIGQSLEAFVTVLVVACPCSLGLATPLALVVSIGNSTKKGLVIKSSEVLEQLNKIDTIVFDKTGTLTKGELEIVDKKINEHYQLEEVLKILASIEKNSNHPIAKAIVKNRNAFYKVEDFQELSGKGVKGKINRSYYYAGNHKFLEECSLKNTFLECEQEFSKKGESILYLWNDKEVIALFGLRDEVKSDMLQTIRTLKNAAKKIVMLSGDNEMTAKMIADTLEIDTVYSNVSPQDKVEVIKKLNKSENVLMVGDGINDAPALKTATIGISVSNGTDISNDASDIIMLSEDMNRLVDLFRIGKNTIRIIKQNLFWALFYNVCMIPLATGLLPIRLNPMIASLAMVISSFTVVMNSLRLKK